MVAAPHRKQVAFHVRAGRGEAPPSSWRRPGPPRGRRDVPVRQSGQRVGVWKPRRPKYCCSPAEKMKVRPQIRQRSSRSLWVVVIVRISNVASHVRSSNTSPELYTRLVRLIAPMRLLPRVQVAPSRETQTSLNRDATLPDATEAAAEELACPACASSAEHSSAHGVPPVQRAAAFSRCTGPVRRSCAAMASASQSHRSRALSACGSASCAGWLVRRSMAEH